MSIIAKNILERLVVEIELNLNSVICMTSPTNISVVFSFRLAIYCLEGRRQIMKIVSYIFNIKTSVCSIEIKIKVW